MKKRKKIELSEKEVLAKFFCTDDLKEDFGTEDPLEIIASWPGDSVGTEPQNRIWGFEEEAAESNELVRLVKEEQAKLIKLRSKGSLEYLARKLSKSIKQIGTYCKEKKVPGAYQTKGGQWRVPYDDDTLQKVRIEISGSERHRTEGWLIERLRKHVEVTEDDISDEELAYPKEKLKNVTRVEYECIAAARNLFDMGKRVSLLAVAKLTGLSRTTVRKYLPDIKTAGRKAAFSNNPLIDSHNQHVNKKNGKVSTQSYDSDYEDVA